MANEEPIDNNRINYYYDNMKIKETDFMWKCYKRYYAEQQLVPPGNLCRYFWVSCLGLFRKVFWDVNFFMLVGSLVLTSVGLMFISAGFEPYTSIVLPPAILASLLFFSSIFVVIVRPTFAFIGWLEKKIGEKLMEKLLDCFMWFISVSFLSFIAISVVVNYENIEWQKLYEGLYTFGVTFGALIGAYLLYAIVYYSMPTKEFFKTFLEFLKAKKDKVCPLMEMPDHN